MLELVMSSDCELCCLCRDDRIHLPLMPVPIDNLEATQMANNELSLQALR